MITINYNLTPATFVDTNLEGHLLSVTATAAILTGVGRWDFLKQTSGTFSLGFCDREKLRPRHIQNAFCQTVISDHVGNLQLFDGNPVETVNQLLRLFVVKILARAGDLAVRQRNFLPGFLTVRAALFLLAQTALQLRQLVRRVLQMARIGYRFARAQGGELFDAYIHTHALPCLGQGFRLGHLTDQQSKPAICAPRNAQLFNRAFKGTAQSHATTPNTWDCEPVTFQRAAALRFNLLRKRVIAITRLEARETRLPFGRTLEKRRESFVQAFQGVSLNGAQTGFHTGQFVPRFGQLTRLLVEADTFAGLPVETDPLLQRAVVDEAGIIQRALTGGNKLLPGAQDFVLKRLGCGIFRGSRLRVTLHRNAFWLGWAGSTAPV